MSVLDKPEQITLFRFATLIAGLKLECKGMKNRGPSAASILKRERKYKGTNVQVLALAQADYAKEKAAFDLARNASS